MIEKSKKMFLIITEMSLFPLVCLSFFPYSIIVKNRHFLCLFFII